MKKAIGTAATLIALTLIAGIGVVSCDTDACAATARGGSHSSKSGRSGKTKSHRAPAFHSSTSHDDDDEDDSC
jgi:hypothetical protein